MALVLDTGALIGLDRNDRALWALLKSAALDLEPVVVPAAALAQAWRGGPRQARLAAALDHCETASFDALARDAGELCGRAQTSDVVDASVALTAARVGGALVTGDPLDLRRLLRAIRGALSVRVVAC